VSVIIFSWKNQVRLIPAKLQKIRVRGYFKIEFNLISELNNQVIILDYIFKRYVTEMHMFSTIFGLIF